MKHCPRCASEIYSSMKKCPRCGLPVSQMDFSDDEEKQEETRKLTKNERKALNKRKKEQKKKEKRERRIYESKSDTDFSKFASNRAHEEDKEPSEDVKGLLNKRRLQKKQAVPEFELDENGEFNIDTSDVEIVGEETGRLIEERYGGNSYSVKKERGDYRPPKIKWWEIYKFADRSFARRKIKKEVSKAAKIKPDFMKKWKLLLLAILFGWMGAHNFYAKNFKKGWTSLICIVVSIIVIRLGMSIEFFSKISLSVGGSTGFIALFIWITDIIAIIFNNFKYRIQKEEFIFGMNIETRAKLGEKYIDLELYKKPWWVRMKAWFERKKRDYQEWKHDRRQAMIDKEKRKLAAAEKAEKERKEKEVADAEQETLLKELRAFQTEGEVGVKEKKQKNSKGKKAQKSEEVAGEISEPAKQNEAKTQKPVKSNSGPKLKVNTKNKRKK